MVMAHLNMCLSSQMQYGKYFSMRLKIPSGVQRGIQLFISFTAQLFFYILHQ